MTSPKLVYVVDDDKALAAAYSLELGKLGYQVKVANDGDEGARLVATGHPAAVILDMLMPNKDGMELLRQIRSNPATVDAKAVVVSNFEAPAGIEELGVSKYLSKMLNPPEAVAMAIDHLLTT